MELSMKVKTQFLLNLRLHLVAVVGPYQSSAFSWYSWIFNCFQIFFPVFIFSKLGGGIGTFYLGATKRWKMVSRKESIPAAPTIPQNPKNSVSRFNSCHILRPT